MHLTIIFQHSPGIYPGGIREKEQRRQRRHNPRIKEACEENSVSVLPEHPPQFPSDENPQFTAPV